ncbi:uncharacterized protein VTP21DRAFT_1282 [Calcarisporiella thermophila]|uniref:uncharacterized protein n=1 Tax=Calcarisporiella thermophila TaxID=911321 RepID=UPI0037420E5C
MPRYRSNSRSSSPRRHRSRSFSRSPSRSFSRSRSPPPKSSKIYVDNLTRNVTREHLEEIFGRYGRIIDIDLPMNRTLGSNRGFAIIEFDNRSGAENAIHCMDKGQLDGETLACEIHAPAPRVIGRSKRSKYDSYVPRRRSPSPRRRRSFHSRSRSRSRSYSPEEYRGRKRNRSRSYSNSRSKSYSDSRSRSYSRSRSWSD